jgi:hypothetical protein
VGESCNSGIHEGICYLQQDELEACENLGRHVDDICVGGELKVFKFASL